MVNNYSSRQSLPGVSLKYERVFNIDSGIISYHV